MKRSLKKTSAILVGIVLSIPLAIFGFFAYQNVTTRASDSEPRDVVISEITDSSVLITWSTDQPTQGVIEYGTSPTTLVFFAPEAQKVQQHEVELTLLTPKTTHYFHIRVNDTVFDNGGVPWTFTTKGSGEESDEASGSPGSETPSSGTPSAGLSASPSPSSQVSPTSSSQSPAPTQVPATPTEAFSCEDQDDCQKILQKLNKGCSTADYVRCIKRSAPIVTYTPVPTKKEVTPTEEPDNIDEEEEE